LFTVWPCGFCVCAVCYSPCGGVGSIEIIWKAVMGGVRDAKYKHVFEQETVTEKINRMARMYVE